MRVLIAVTHLLGAGHLVRASAVGRALSLRGHDVTLVSGGVPMPLAEIGDLDFVQLPPVRCRVGDFSILLDRDGHPLRPGHLEARRERLLAVFGRVRPQVLVTEHFPFGRRSLQAEFQALLDAAEAATPAPLVLGSIRDILVAPAKAEKVERTHALVARRYDAILVHGDPGVVPLEHSWPVDEALRRKLIYTGYVGPDAPAIGETPPERERMILVSGGSSAASLPLYLAAVAAARAGRARPWRLLVGPGVEQQAFHQLAASAPPHVSVERVRPDFRALLSRAAVFVGQAGYNTVMDIIATHARAVLVPFEAGHETEQRLRAASLAERGLVTLLTEDALGPDTLLAAIRDAEARPRPVFDMALDGHHRSAAVIERLVAERSACVAEEAAS